MIAEGSSVADVAETLSLSRKTVETYRERFASYNQHTMGGDLLAQIASEEVRRRDVTLGDGLAHDLGNSLGVESGLKRDLTANILNADLYFHSGASQPIKKLLSPLFVV